MTKHDILSISLKILGVISIMYTIVLIPNIGLAIGFWIGPYVDKFQSYWRIWQFIISLIWPVGAFVMGYILLKWGDNIANILIKDDKEIKIKAVPDWEMRIFKLSLKIIGVIWLIRGIPDLVKSIGELVVRWYIYYYSIPHIILVLLGAIVSIIIGIYLITKGQYLIELAFPDYAQTSVTQEDKKS